LNAVAWKDEEEVYILMNMNQSPTEANFYDEYVEAGHY
jgi:hypothetical protein